MEQDSNHSDDGVRRADYASEKGEVVLRTHEYDGIQEYDQKLPNWWLFTLWASIGAFLVYYTLYYTLDLLPSSQDQMDQRVEEIQAVRKKALEETLAKLDDNVLVNEWSTNTEIVAAGKDTYGKMCAACHGADLAANGGTTGRPLNDGIWEYGDKPMDVFKIINEGSPEGSKGLNGLKMVAWGKSGLTPKQVAELTAYLINVNPKDFAALKE